MMPVHLGRRPLTTYILPINLYIFRSVVKCLTTGWEKLFNFSLAFRLSCQSIYVHFDSPDLSMVLMDRCALQADLFYSSFLLSLFFFPFSCFSSSLCCCCCRCCCSSS